MSGAAVIAAHPSPLARLFADPVRLSVVVAMAVGLLARATVGWNAPLWFDETFTATIATAESPRELYRWLTHEIGGPVHYSTTWLWQQVAGSSNFALRLPSFACSLATLALIWHHGHAEVQVRRLWAAGLAVWLPGLLLAGEARGYALLLLLTTAQAILFLRFFETRRLSLAFAWSTVSALGVLTHYHALVLAGLQGVILALRHRRHVLALAPALLPFGVMAAWMSVHLPFVLAFQQPGTAWQRVLDLASLVDTPMLLFGPNPIALPLFVALLLGLFGWWREQGTPFQPMSAEALLVASALAGAGVVLALGFVTPSFTPRYLYLFIPPLFFGIALCLKHHASRRPLAVAAALLASAATAAGDAAPRVAARALDERTGFSFEAASVWIGERDVHRLVFFWDSNTAQFGPDENFRALGGFFLRRAGQSVEVVALRPAQATSPNAAILQRAGRDGAVLWMWSEVLGRPKALTEPPRLASATRECRDFGRNGMHIYACRPAPSDR